MALRLDDGRLRIVGREARVRDPTPQGLDPPGGPRGPIVGPLVLVLVPTGHHTGWPGVGGRCGAVVVLAGAQNWFPNVSGPVPPPLMSESATSYLSLSQAQVQQ